MFNVEYLISALREVNIAGDCSQKAGAILETLDIKISQRESPQPPSPQDI